MVELVGQSLAAIIQFEPQGLYVFTVLTFWLEPNSS